MIDGLFEEDDKTTTEQRSHIVASTSNRQQPTIMDEDDRTDFRLFWWLRMGIVQDQRRTRWPKFFEIYKLQKFVPLSIRPKILPEATAGSQKVHALHRK